MFETLRIKFSDPLFQGMALRVVVAILLIAGMVGAVLYVQNLDERGPIKSSVARQDEVKFESENARVDDADSRGDADELFAVVRDKRDNWKKSFVERLTDCQLRIQAADRLLELPVEPYMKRLAQTAMLRGVMTEHTVYRQHSSIPEDRVETMALTAMEFRGEEGVEIKNLVLAADSLTAMAKLLDTATKDVTDELINDAAAKLAVAAEANRDDLNIATTHFFWIDWARTKLGDAKCVPLVDAVAEHYSQSKIENVRGNMRRVRLSMD